MKLKSYLIVSHLLVLLTPILTIGILYKLNNEYNKRTEVKNYLAANIELFKYEEMLDNPLLYTQPNRKLTFKEIEESEDVEVILYNQKGKTIYSSIPHYAYMLSVDELYKNLNTVQHTYRTDVLKKPVFSEGQIVGFYQITIPRDNLTTTVKRNFLLSVGCFIMVNVLILAFTIKRLNTRFNKPLKNVIQSMNHYAKGDENVHIYYKATDEIGELCDHFNYMKDEIEKSKNEVAEEQKAKEYMIATISHDLKTPLTAIRAYTEMIKLGNIAEREKYEAALDTVLSKCDYMKDMLDDFLTYKLLSMEYDIELVEVEGEEFCDMLFAGIEGICESKELVLEQVIEVNGDYKVNAKYMARVIDNIVSNAIRHTPENGHIWMGAFSSLESLPEWVEEPCKNALRKYQMPGMWILIKNEGNAILPLEANNLFKPFYQGDEARSKKDHKGAGLGLSICQMIMEKHGGAIEMIPIENIGNIMVCYLPGIVSSGEVT